MKREIKFRQWLSRNKHWHYEALEKCRAIQERTAIQRDAHYERCKKAENELMINEAKLLRLNELIINQNNYIKFLERECKRTATFLHVHNMNCGQEIAEEGQRLRDYIQNNILSNS